MSDMKIIKINSEEYAREITKIVYDAAVRLSELREKIMVTHRFPLDRHKELMMQLTIEFVVTLMAYVLKEENRIAKDLYEKLAGLSLDEPM